MHRIVCLTLGLLVSVSALTDEERKTMNELMRETIGKCMKEYNLTEEKMAIAMETKDYKGIDPCFLACVFKANQILNDKGMYDPTTSFAVAKKYIESSEDLEKLKKVGEICSAVGFVQLVSTTSGDLFQGACGSHEYATRDCKRTARSLKKITHRMWLKLVGRIQLNKKLNKEEVSDGKKGCDRAILLSDCFMENNGDAFY